jgi:hypothetical protein
VDGIIKRQRKDPSGLNASLVTIFWILYGLIVQVLILPVKVSSSMAQPAHDFKVWLKCPLQASQAVKEFDNNFV